MHDIPSQYALYLRGQEKSPATIEKYTRYAGIFLAFTGDKPIAKEDVVAWKERVAGAYTAAGANGMIAAVNSYLAFLGRPELRVKPLRVQRGHFALAEKALCREDLDMLIAQARRQGKHRLALVVQTMSATGIRVGELRFITTEAVLRGYAEIRLKGKVRTILLPGKLCQRLLAWARQTGVSGGAIFVTRGGKALDRSNIWADMKRLCDGANVPAAKVFPHNLRHLFARTYYEYYPDLVELAGIMGHSDINTTRIYAASSDAECRRRLDAMNLVP